MATSNSNTLTLATTFDVRAPRARVWAVVADTEHLNQQVFGLSRIEILSVDTNVIRAKGGLVGAEFDEHPWEFLSPERYRSERIYTKGPLKRMLTDVKLDETEQGTRVTVFQEVDAADGLLGAIARPFLPVQWRRVMNRFRQLLEGIPPDEQLVWPYEHAQSTAILARMRPIAETLKGDGIDEHALDGLLSLIAKGPDADTSRIRPYALADAAGISRRAMLETCLHATRAGLLRLSWDLLCPSCEGPGGSASTLKDLKPQGHCALCDVDIGANFERNIEATFAPSPDIRSVERVLFCLGSPTRTKSWIAQVIIAPGTTKTIELALGEGRYRVQASSVNGQSVMDVREDGADSVDIRIAPAGTSDALEPQATRNVRRGVVKVNVKNDDSVAHRVQIAHRAFASEAATAADVTATGLFRDIFGQDALGPDQHIEIGNTSILFTDLVGSTAMYEREGDATAYGLVRTHFERLFAVVEKYEGRVVKTVGDAVMASFPSALLAAEAGLAAVDAIRDLAREEPRARGLALRVGVHIGPCLAVEANGNIDYFGRTVNVAARVESLGGRDELVLSDAVRTAYGVDAWVSQITGADVRVDEAMVKGVERAVQITRIVRPAPTAT
jgi:class 3 adenylate cyclase/carbon monoxide dehydrogenase subunit G